MNCLVIVTYLTLIASLNSRDKTLFSAAQDDEASEFNGCYNMSAYNKARSSTATLRTDMKARIGAKCETSANYDNCVKDEVMKTITPASFKKQVNTFLLDLSAKLTLGNIVDSCFSGNKREFYSCYLTGLKRTCPELAGFVDSVIATKPWYFS